MHNISIARHGKYSDAETGQKRIFIDVRYYCEDCDCEHFFFIIKSKSFPIMPGNCGCIITGQYDVPEIDEAEDWRYYKILAELMKDEHLRRSIDSIAKHYNVN